MDTSGKDLEVHKRLVLSQHRIKRLEQESNIYKQRLLQLSQISAIKPEIDGYLRKNDLKNIIEVPPQAIEDNLDSKNSSDTDSLSNLSNGKQTERLLDMSFSSENGTSLPPVPPRRVVDLMSGDTPTTTSPAVGTRLEGLLLDEFENDQDFDPRGFENGLSSNDILNMNTYNGNNITNGNTNNGNNIINMNGNNMMNGNAPILAPPPKAARRQVMSNNNNGVIKNNLAEDIFGSTPAFTAPVTPKDPFNTSKDPFEMGDFNGIQASYQDAIGLLDKRVLEINVSYSVYKNIFDR